MRRKLVRMFVWMTALQIVAFIVGQALAKKLTRGDEDSDEFQIASFFGGKRFESHARDLKMGVVLTSMGGIQLDLTDASLHEAGADLELKTTMGGIMVTVPDDWAVELDGEAMAGGFDARVTQPEELPDDAPKLHVHAVARMGGVLVTTADESQKN